MRVKFRRPLTKRKRRHVRVRAKVAGRLVGKAEKKENLAQYSFKRVVGNKTVQVTVKKSDPMRFDNIRLAKGPAESYPSCSVTGRPPTSTSPRARSRR